MATRTTLEKMNLDVDSSDKVAHVLRCAVEAFYESASECKSIWKDSESGRPWEIIAAELEKTAERIERALLAR